MKLRCSRITAMVCAYKSSNARYIFIFQKNFLPWLQMGFMLQTYWIDPFTIIAILKGKLIYLAEVLLL